MDDLLAIFEFDKAIGLLILGFIAVVFIPYIQLVRNKKVRANTSSGFTLLIFAELVIGIILMFFISWNVLKDEVVNTFEGVLDNPNAVIDSSKVVNLNIPRMLLPQDTTGFDKWNPVLGRWGIDAIIRLEAGITSGKQAIAPPGTKLIKTFTDVKYAANRKDFYLMLLSVDENPGMFVLVLRGTLTPGEWRENMEYGLSPTPFLGFNGTDFYKDVMIHTGFLQTYNTMREAILNEIKKVSGNSPVRLFITGHSAGAAISAIVAADLEANVSNVERMLVYVFACPRPGNFSFSKYIASREKMSMYRISNTSDLITQIPPPVAPNIHSPEDPYPYTHVGKLHSFRDNRHSLFANHFLSTYAKWLDSAVINKTDNK